MARRYRFVVPGRPHHVIQRGNRSQRVFFSDDDRIYYLNLLEEHAAKFGVIVWAYCLMSNHVHLILVPSEKDSLAKTVAETHRRYTRMINFREKWRGYLWQGRFSSFVMDDIYLLNALRYVELNPVRAKMTLRAQDYPWSSAQAHVDGSNDKYLTKCPAIKAVKEWGDFLQSKNDEAVFNQFRLHSSTGRPVGEMPFIEEVARYLQISVADLQGRAPGRPKKM